MELAPGSCLRPSGGVASSIDASPTDDAKTPVTTKPLGKAQHEAWFQGTDIVAALRIYDGDREYDLPSKSTFTLGASRSCDVSVIGRDLSALHCAFERRGMRLRVHDQHSTNGMFFGGRRVDLIDLYPGDTFTAAPVTFIAMNEQMRAQRQIIADLVGSSFTPTPDRVLVDAVKSSNHLLITGETGCDLDRLARAIHAVSLRRSCPLVEIAELPEAPEAQRDILERTARSTLLIRLDVIETPLDPSFLSMAFSPDYHIRVIAIAATTRMARKLLAIDEMEQLQHIWVRPLSMRPGDVPELLDHLLAERQAGFRLADLSPSNHDVLCSYHWRDNFIGLRLAADRLAAIARVQGWEAMNWQERSNALGLPKTTTYNWFNGLGLTLPLFAA